MIRSRKSTIFVGAALAAVMFVATAGDNFYTLHASASGSNATCGLIGGMSAYLEAEDAEEVIYATAEELNIEIGAPEVVEEVVEISNVVMANVYQSLNVREEPTTDSARVGLLYKDCGGTILERGEGWTKLQSGNIIGWCSNEFLLFEDEAERLAANVGITFATVKVEALRVREEGAEDSTVLSLMSKGEIVEVIGAVDGDWVKIDCDGVDGYVLSECVDITFQIDAGETNEEIEIREAAEREAKRHVTYGAYTTDADTTLLLAALIQCEAGGETYEGQVAVGAVVMNRVRSAAYPNTIHGVIYASGQFTPAMSGRVDAVYMSGKIKPSCIEAAKEAINGTSNVGDLTHFRRNDGRDGIVIGNHVFF